MVTFAPSLMCMDLGKIKEQFAVMDQYMKLYHVEMCIRDSVYGWTANSKETIEKNLQCQVDGIVTDNPELVNHYVMQTRHNRLLSALLQTFFNTTLADQNDMQ